MKALRSVTGRRSDPRSLKRVGPEPAIPEAIELNARVHIAKGGRIPL